MGDFNTPLSSMERSCRQKINKETQALNDTSDQIDLIDIYRAFYPNATEYTFFSCAQGTFSRTDHMLGHKKQASGFPGGTVVKNLPANAGNTGLIPGLGRSHMPWIN